ncbi:MAG: hypothetical protein LBQ69_04825 [Treponema sp.]|jgi:hypothetical protein|nr:hypothetical protein [Treponema sp.]
MNTRTIAAALALAALGFTACPSPGGGIYSGLIRICNFEDGTGYQAPVFGAPIC